MFDFVNLTRTFETASSFAAFDFCAILSSVWHLDTSSDCVSSERDFFGGLEGKGDLDITEFDITESDITIFQETDITESDITEFDITESDITNFQEFDITEFDITEKGN